MSLDPSLLLLLGFLAGAGFVLLLRFLWSRIPRSPAGWDGPFAVSPYAADFSSAGGPPFGASGPGNASASAATPSSPPSTPPGSVAAPSAAVSAPTTRIPVTTESIAPRSVPAPGGPTVPLGSTIALAPESPANRARSPPTLRLSMRVVLHLQRQPRITRFDLAPLAMTQAGMVVQLEATQSALAKVLVRLVAAGVLEERREHVQGQGRRLKVYQLTPTGEALARDLRRRVPAPAGPADRPIAARLP